MGRTLVGAFALLLIAIAVSVWLGQLRWQRTTRETQQRLYASAREPRMTRYSEAELSDLPPPVARYFRNVLKDGQPIIRRAHVSWKGEFNMGKPGADKWVAFSAGQTFVPGAPGFVWDARMSMGYGLETLVRDAIVDGAGSMRAKVLGLVTVVDGASTPALSTSALQRYLGEAVWFPTALLPSQGVRWEGIDDSRARASITAASLSTSLEFRFGPDGLIASVYAAQRTFDDGSNPPALHPWQARNLHYGEFHAMKVPVESVAEWLLPAGPYAYWRGSPARVEYEYAE